VLEKARTVGNFENAEVNMNLSKTQKRFPCEMQKRTGDPTGK
jgi:hypothetical protein